MVQALPAEFLEGHARTLEYNQSLHRMASPFEIAKLNAFLLSEDSSFITGAGTMSAISWLSSKDTDSVLVYVADGGQVC